MRLRYPIITLFSKNLFTLFARTLGKAAVGSDFSSGGPHHYQNVRDFIFVLCLICVMISHFLSSLTWPMIPSARLWTLDNSRAMTSILSSGSSIFFTTRWEMNNHFIFLNCILFLFLSSLSVICHEHGQESRHVSTWSSSCRPPPAWSFRRPLGSVWGGAWNWCMVA